MLKHGLATVALIALSAPAFAGGLAPSVPEPVVAVPAPVAAPQPTADWSGFYVGIHAGNADFTIKPHGTAPVGPAAADDTFYGIHAGYMHDFGRLVVGGELSYSDVSEIAWGDTMISVRARMGYDMGRVLPYLTVGYGELETVGFGKESGPQYGIGAEYAVTDRWRLGVEYIRFDLDDFNGAPFNVASDIVGVRASFRF